MHTLSLHNDFCVVVPVYNHADTFANVVNDIRLHGFNVLVVNDGSTDSTHNRLEQLSQKIGNNQPHLHVLSYPKNRGKGYALYQAFKCLSRLGYSHALTMDADGQHLSKDILLIIQDIHLFPNAICVGSREAKHKNQPPKNRFANHFSNFWFFIQTGKYLPDTQSGFRLYPIKTICRMYFVSKRYEWELEVLVRLAWAGIPIITKPISVYYPPPQESLSHFRPGIDFLRISILNTLLCFGALFYYYPLCFLRLFFRLFKKLM